MVAADDDTPKDASPSASEAKTALDRPAKEDASKTSSDAKDMKEDIQAKAASKTPPKKATVKRPAAKKTTAKKKTATKNATSSAKKPSEEKAKTEVTADKSVDEAPPSSTAQQITKSDGIPGGIVGLLALLLVSAFGGGFVASQFAGSDGSSMGADTSALEGQVARLQEELQAVKDVPETSNAPQIDMAPIEESITTLENRVAGLEQALLDMNDRSSNVTVNDGVDTSELNALMDSLATVNDDIANLRRELEENVSARVEALEKNAPPADLEETLAGLAPRQNLVALRQRLIALEQDETGSDAKQAALSLAVANLARASQMGQPFAQELEAITILDPAFTAPASLKDVAETGLQRRDQLIVDFGPTARSAFSAQWQSENASWWDNLMANLRGLVTVRQTGDVEGDSLEAIIARTEIHLAKADLPAALQEVKAITGPAADVLADWRTQVEAQLQLDEVMRDLNTNVFRQFEDVED